MNRKKAIWIIAIGLIVVAIVVLWLFMRTKTDVPVDEPGPECPFFQTSNPSAPCYLPSGVIDTPEPTTGTTVPATFPAQCADEATVIDRNECVTVLAAESRRIDACEFVVGSLAKASCLNGVIQKPVILPQAPDAYQNYLEVFVKGPVSTVEVPRVVTSSGIPDMPVATTTDSRFTMEGFVNRATTDAELKVFALSHYQAKPGETVQVYGSGFVYPSTVMVGSIPIHGLRSVDGFSLSFTAPSSTGEYEISVTNSKGSSGSARPKLLITDSPAPRPQITSASPSIVDVSGEVTLTGIGFMDTNIITTTLGVVQNVSSNGTSLRFRIADLTVVSQVKDLPEVKGMRVPVGVYVNNANGFNQDLFYFDVQF
ncbi:MAG: hypothetical protein Q8L64_06515 [bacterium]|nr:hypothetical protein [bacterium]